MLRETVKEILLEMEYEMIGCEADMGSRFWGVWCSSS